MLTLLTAVPELRPIKAGATRAGEALDEVYCNIDRCIVEKEILKPLCKEDGTESDHAIIAAAAKLPKASRAKATSFSFRPLTKKGTDKFKALLAATDWSTVKKNDSSNSAAALTNILDTYV